MAGSGATLGVVVAYGAVAAGPPSSPRCPTASSTCTSRCCRAGAARRPSSGRSSRATRRPACASCASTRASTPAGCTRRRGVAIGPDETAGELRARLVELGAELLVAHLAEVPRREPEPQVGEPTYADKLTVEEFAIDPARPAAELHRSCARATRGRARGASSAAAG